MKRLGTEYAAKIHCDRPYDLDYSMRTCISEPPVSHGVHDGCRITSGAPTAVSLIWRSYQRSSNRE